MLIAQSFSESSSVSIRLIEVQKKGAAAARNAAVKVSKGDWLAFTDSDCIPDSDWLEQGMAKIQAQSCVAMAGPAWGTMEGDLSAKLLSLTTLSVGAEAHWQKHVGDTGVNGFASANLWVKKQVFEALHGFDVALAVSGEDYDLCARMYQMGHAIYYHPQLRVRHIHPSGLVALLSKAVAYGSAHGFLFDKYGKTGVYVDVLGGRQVSLSAPFKFWVNLVSAEKKMAILFVFALFCPVFWVLVALYPVFISRFLFQRAKALSKPLHWFQAYQLGWLLVIRSLAFTVGRIKGSRWGVWVF
jgi:glycosyltransferase involved in cell wall biosynthesis